MLDRARKNIIIKDLEKKMVFLIGPRQVGKTWLSKEIGKSFTKPLYLNFDALDDRDRILHADWVSDVDLIILDELHKMPEWKNHVKGIFDTKKPHQKILVTGSARLDVFKQSGDSLAGRFFQHHIFPLSLGEFSRTQETRFNLEDLINRGGFPEALLAENDVDANRWRLTYADTLIRDDIFDFETIHDFRALKLTFNLLRRQVGSTVSFASLARDVGVSPATIVKYVQTFEALYIVFRVTPYSKNIARSLLKEPKIYFYDTGLVMGDAGARFENFVAVSLLAHVSAMQDLQGENWELKYLRTKEQQEVDFALVKDDVI